MSAGNFDHLNELDPTLATIGRFAERYFVDDANTTLVKTRQFAERLTSVVVESAGLGLIADEKFVDTLRRIQLEAAAPREILDILHKLRRAGNVAVHDVAGERRDAFQALKLCHRLGVWLRATLTRKPGLTMAFRPPLPAVDEAAELRTEMEALRTRLAQTETEAERQARITLEAVEARAAAEDKARLAEEERAIYAELAEEAVRRALAPVPAPEQRRRFVAAALDAARELELDEADTRLLIDEQLRQAGWQADSRVLRHGSGTRPERGKHLAIAEWPTASGPADYALFVGERLVAVVEAKRKRRDVAAAIGQAERYSRGLDWASGGQAAGGPWDGYRAPFAFATNGRALFPQFRTQSGIWFRDLRRPTNAARPLEGWPTPAGLIEQLETDRDAAAAALRARGFDFGFALRPYQIAAIRAVEGAIEADRREMLVAMATGTGKTKLSIALTYRLLEARRFNRVCFVVDRNALGQQAQGAFETTRMIGAKTFADIFGLRSLADRDIDRDAKVHVCTVQSLVQRVLARTPEDRPPIDQYDVMIIDECHRGYLLDRAGKTLVFAASDRHADAVVDHLREAYRAQGLEIEDGMIRRITGSVDRVGELILAFKNDEDPRIAVTVDLLTTGIDVPPITSLVFLRRVNSRILYDQMIGRATRLCPEIGKDVFQIYDAVDLYPNLQAMTEMRPVVVNPAVTFESLFSGLECTTDDAHGQEILDQIIVKLARKVRRMPDELRAQYTAQAGETPEDTLTRLRGSRPAAVRGWARDRPGLGAFFDFEGPRGAPPIIPIYPGPDAVTGVTSGYPAGGRPADFIDSFAAFIRENANRIAALNLVLTRPRDLTRESLKELRLALVAHQFTEPNLRAAWRAQTNEDVAASIIGFVRQAALGDPLVPYAERVDRAVRARAARHATSDVQRRWLEQIGREIKARIVVDRAALDEPPFAHQGGFKRLDRVFDGRIEAILQEIAAATWEPAA